jgi:membrane fusion protein (multidrug efflux system)
VFITFNSCGDSHETAHESEHENHHEGTKFLVTSPIMLDTSSTEEYVCQIQAIRHIELRAQERGFLKKVYIDEGQFVQEGQLLFQIMPNLYEAELRRVKAEADYVRIEYENTRLLADSNVVAPNELAMAKAKLDKVSAELSLAQVHLDLTQIKAPYSGLVDRFYVRRGSLIDEGELLTELSDNSKMWVYFNVPEAEYLDYKIHYNDRDKPKVKLMMANNELFPYDGIIETIEADFDNETGNIPFRATFPNPERLLRHGETGNILMSIEMKDAIVIPQKATFEILDKKYVFVLDENDVAHQREVTTIDGIEDIYVVAEGLEVNDKIILEGLQKVRDDDKIEYSFQDPRMVIAHLKLASE